MVAEGLVTLPQNVAEQMLAGGECGGMVFYFVTHWRRAWKEGVARERAKDRGGGAGGRGGKGKGTRSAGVRWNLDEGQLASLESVPGLLRRIGDLESLIVERVGGVEVTMGGMAGTMGGMAETMEGIQTQVNVNSETISGMTETMGVMQTQINENTETISAHTTLLHTHTQTLSTHSHLLTTHSHLLNTLSAAQSTQTRLSRNLHPDLRLYLRLLPLPTPGISLPFIAHPLNAAFTSVNMRGYLSATIDGPVLRRDANIDATFFLPPPAAADPAAGDTTPSTTTTTPPTSLDKLLIFMGHSGSGKSTLVAAIHAAATAAGFLTTLCEETDLAGKKRKLTHLGAASRAHTPANTESSRTATWVTMVRAGGEGRGRGRQVLHLLDLPGEECSGERLGTSEICQVLHEVRGVVGELWPAAVRVPVPGPVMVAGAKRKRVAGDAGKCAHGGVPLEPGKPGWHPASRKLGIQLERMMRRWRDGTGGMDAGAGGAGDAGGEGEAWGEMDEKEVGVVLCGGLDRREAKTWRMMGAWVKELAR